MSFSLLALKSIWILKQFWRIWETVNDCTSLTSSLSYSIWSESVRFVFSLSNLLILSCLTLMNLQIESSELFSCMLSLLWHDLSSHADKLNSGQIFMLFASQVCLNDIITSVHVACYCSSKIIEQSFDLSFSFLLQFRWTSQSFSSALNQQSSNLHFSLQIHFQQSIYLLI